MKRQVDATALQKVNEAPMSRDELSATNWKMGVRLFARDGKHCDTILIIARGRTLLPEFEKQCAVERTFFQKDPKAWFRRHHGADDPRGQ